MSLPKIKDFTDFNHYPSDPQPTTDADMQDYMQNQNDILAALTKRLWQPQTEYKLGDIVASDTMADGLVAVCTIAGVTSDIEPTWGVNEATVIDNSCTWIMRPAYCYGLATEGDVQTVHDGGSAEDSRLLSLGVLDKIFALIKDKFTDLFGSNDVLPIEHGGTGATTASDARTNLGLSTAVTDASISGKTITLTKADGTTQRLTTQDTNTNTAFVPNYSAKYTVSTSESKKRTATENCIFVVDCTNNNENACIFVDGMCVTNTFASINGRACAWVIVPKGSVHYATNYTRKGNPSPCTQYVIPLKAS